MKTRSALATAIILLAGALIYTALVYSRLPDKLPIHWNIKGIVDGWADKRTALMMMPLTVAVMFMLIPLLPAISPKAFNLDTSRDSYNYIMVVLIALMIYIHIIIIVAGMSTGLDTGKALMAGMYGFFALMGNTLGKVRRNMWMGVKTPWTLASDKVWDPTHRLAGKLMVLGGVGGGLLTIVGVSSAITFPVVMALLLYPCLYSYTLYKKLEAAGDL